MKAPAILALLLLFPVLGWAEDGPLQAQLRKADALDAQLKNKEALAVLLEAEKSAPEDPELLHRIAKQYGLSMDDASNATEKKAAGQKALDYSRRAVAAGPKNAKAHLALAISYGRLAPLLDSKTKIAYSKLVKEEAELSLQLDPTDDLTHHVLGAWNYELANLNAVLRALARVIYGKLPPASNSEAVRYFKQAIAIAPQKVASHVELGRTYLAMGQAELARASLNEGLRLPSREKDDETTKERAREALRQL